jgi:hypothetical protein
VSDDLTPEQAELLEEIESDEPSEADVQALERVIEKFDFTATLLGALAQWLREEGDPDGSDIVLDCASEMARHEARTA